ncbi:MAG: FAD-binding oxidoreductase [Deferribacteres bacterium]|nr:FAD-binding oxidoreductase [candidate division KSB1 bacterium]MCB9503782.1 FAD-binding oxidoreductase [Deferribacteres bacterium]
MLDYLIVGQGIAGTSLAHFLLQREKHICVIDEETTHSSTRVAIGTCNPITGNNFVKTWLADSVFPFARQFYATLEHEFGEQFFYPKMLYRIFPDEKRKAKWLRKCEQPEYAGFVAESEVDEQLSRWANNPLGSIEIKQAGFVDTNKLLSKYRAHLRERQMLREQKLDFSKLRFDENQVHWHDLSARKIIFCEGSTAIANPLFMDLPISLNKGQIVTVHIPDCPIDAILKKKCIVLPWGNEIYKVGATYEADFENLNPTDAGKEILQEQLEDLFKVPFEIIEHKVGVRPASVDRKPLIGLHHKQNMAGIFNGFGAKGLTLAPWFAQHFVAHLEEGVQLLDEVSIRNYPQRTVRNR